MDDKGTRLMAAAWLAALIGGFFALDAIFALDEQSCASATNLGGCVPWGAEGPSGGSWLWKSKANYVFAGLFPFFIAALVLVGLTRQQDQLDDLPRWKGLLILAVIVAPFGVRFV